MDPVIDLTVHNVVLDVHWTIQNHNLSLTVVFVFHSSIGRPNVDTLRSFIQLFLEMLEIPPLKKSVKINRVFAANSNFQILITLKPDWVV